MDVLNNQSKRSELKNKVLLQLKGKWEMKQKLEGFGEGALRSGEKEGGLQCGVLSLFLPSKHATPSPAHLLGHVLNSNSSSFLCYWAMSLIWAFKAHIFITRPKCKITLKKSLK